MKKSEGGSVAVQGKAELYHQVQNMFTSRDSRVKGGSKARLDLIEGIQRARAG